MGKFSNTLIGIADFNKYFEVIYRLFDTLGIMTRISSHVYLVDAPPRMPEMTSCALLPASHHTNTPFKEHLEVLMWAVLILMPLLLNKGLQFGKELFDRVEIR